jgi:hypothetical protein
VTCFGRCLFWISASTLTVLIGVCHSFLQSFLEHTVLLPLPLPSTSFQFVMH